MDKNTSSTPAPYSAISPFFLPTPPSGFDRPKRVQIPHDRELMEWRTFSQYLTAIAAGHDTVLLQNALDRAAELTRNGEGPPVYQSIQKGLTQEGAFSVEKVQWLSERNYDIAPTMTSPPVVHTTWASAQDREAFDWSIQKLSGNPQSPERDRVLKIWLSAIIVDQQKKQNRLSSFKETMRRLQKIESLKPGIVREWISGYSRKTATNDKVVVLNMLKVFFENALLSGMPYELSEWLDPGKFGTPLCASLIANVAVEFSFKAKTTPVTVPNFLIWPNLARALEVNPAARRYWDKQINSDTPCEVDEVQRVSKSKIPSQSAVFGCELFSTLNTSGSGLGGSAIQNSPAPLDVLGRMLCSGNDYINHIAGTPEGRQGIVECMKSHPRFMLNGFLNFGEDLLSWEESKSLEGFVDIHGFGPVRYFLATLSKVPSSFDTALHRYLRTRKSLCDDASPKMDSLFILPENRSKYMAMELRKISGAKRNKTSGEGGGEHKPSAPKM